MELPDGVILPEDDEIEIGGKKITKLSDHSFETVYGEIKEVQSEIEDEFGFDDGIIEFEDLPEDARESLPVNVDEKNWEEISEKAGAASNMNPEMQGESSGDIMERVRASGESTVDYKRFIQQKITGAIPTDYTFQKPSTQGRGVDKYLPSVKRRNEDVEVVVMLDTSGSISSKLLVRFANEIVGIAKTFECVNITLIQHDAEITDIERIENATERNVEKIDVEGRGGTDHRPPLNHIEDENYEPAVVVGFTDAYSTFTDEPPVKSDYLWVLPADSSVQPAELPFGVVSRIEAESDTQ